MSLAVGPLSWGRAHHLRHAVARPGSVGEAAAALAGPLPALGYGRGRSYGDSCLNDGGLLVETARLDRFIAFDRASGRLEAEAGVTISEVLAQLARPNADGSHWFLPVTPGTSVVTLGGAVANDVHGKNHHVTGSFGCHVPSFTLLRGTGELLTCSSAENPGLYRATIGGLGLTGLLTGVTLQLKRVPGLAVEVEEIRFGNLREFFDLARSSEAGFEYTVAWIDCLARGAALGRGIFSRANHVPGERRDYLPPAIRWSVPLAPPFSPLNRASLTAFNALYWRRLGRSGRRVQRIGYADYLYPLDAIGNWNRLYGRRGFYQYQCVLPPAAAEDGVRAMLDAIAQAGDGSFLAVLKTFGPQPAPGLLSFCREGITLALDFPNRGAGTLALLDRLDAITLAAGGRVYPAKDGRMSAATFRAGYPELDAFAPYVDERFSSTFWRRVAG